MNALCRRSSPQVHPVGPRRARRCLQTAGLVALLLAGGTTPGRGAATFVSGLVPDWNQPYRYTGASPNGGPGPDPMPGVANQWNAWCAPCSAANLAGHWADNRGRAVADTNAFPGSSAFWAAAASWQDHLADGTGLRPAPLAAGGALPAQPTDIGWYLDTNLGIPFDPPAVGTMGGCFYGNPNHVGTYLKDIHAGLQYYLNGRLGLSSGLYWNTGTRGRAFAAGRDPSGAPAAVHLNAASAFAEVASEIAGNRTLILSFQRWNPSPTGQQLTPGGLNSEAALGGQYFTWPTGTPVTNAEDETWNYVDTGSALGHAVTCVGFIPAGDVDDRGPLLGLGPTDWVIVHDNWLSTPRNVIVPFNFAGTWVANTTAGAISTAVKFVRGLVPDWNQPYQYGAQSPNGGPGPDPNGGVVNQWNAWCAPCSAANLAGHWDDHHAVPLADGVPFSGSAAFWAAAPSWQDYLADGTAGRPAPQMMPGPLPTNVTDIGWYMDTNLNVPYDPPGVGMMGGFFFGNPGHAGTFLKDIHLGLKLYLDSLYSFANAAWFTGTASKFFALGQDPAGGPAQVHSNAAAAFGEVRSEIARDRTLLLSYLHWNITPAPTPSLAASGTNTEADLGGSFYVWGPVATTNAENEPWNFAETGENLGHVVTAVGYIPAGDILDPGPWIGLGPTDWAIVHDNWVTTPRNVIIPFDYPGNWLANSIAAPDPAFLELAGVSGAGTNGVVVLLRGLPGGLHALEGVSSLTTTNAWPVVASNVPFQAWTMRLTNAPAATCQFYRASAVY